MAAALPQLFFTPTSCGAASFIVAHKAGLVGTKVDAVLVDLSKHTLLNGPHKGDDFYKYNSKGNVPALLFPDGTLLNEGAAILQWLADQNLASHLAPANGTLPRYVVQSKLNYVASEAHATVGNLFSPSISAETREFITAKYHTKLAYLEKELKGKKFLVGEHFSIADSYLYVVLGWSVHVKVDMTAYPVLNAYHAHIASLDFVTAAHAAMNNMA